MNIECWYFIYLLTAIMCLIIRFILFMYVVVLLFIVCLEHLLELEHFIAILLMVIWWIYSIIFDKCIHKLDIAVKNYYINHSS